MEPETLTALDALYADWRRYFVEYRPIAAALLGDEAGLARLDPGFSDADVFERDEVPRLRGLQQRLQALPPSEDEVSRLVAAALRSRIAAGLNDQALTLRNRRPDLALDWASEALHTLLGWPGLSRERRRALLQTLVERTAEMLRALARRCVETTLPEVLRRLALDALRDLSALYEAHAGPSAGVLGGAVRALRAALRHTPTTPEGFRCGETPLAVQLREVEALSLTPAEVLRAGELRLAEHVERMAEAAARLRPGASAGRVLAELEADHAAPSRLLRETRACVNELAAWVRETGLVTVPEAPPCRVAAAPAYLRALAAACLDVPGPWQRRPARPCYYLAAPLPDDTPAERLAAARQFNRSRLAWVTAHETFPGHLVEHLHRAGAPHEALQVADSEVFVEGWAHYAEGLLVSHGFRDGDPSIALGVAWGRVVRDVRLVASLRLHAGDTPLAEVERLFRREACLGPAEARREALRVVFEPTVFTYALGRDLIEARRRDSPLGDRAFHDALLSRGTLPLGAR